MKANGKENGYKDGQSICNLPYGGFAGRKDRRGFLRFDVIFDLGSSMAGGRVTTRMYSPQPEVDYEKYKGVDVPGENTSTEWCGAVDDETYFKL